MSVGQAHVPLTRHIRTDTMATYQPWTSERTLADTAADLRRLARSSVRTDDYGHLIAGVINPVLEAAKDRLLDCLELIQDGLTAPDAEPAWAQAQDILAYHREEVRHLRQETL